MQKIKFFVDNEKVQEVLKILLNSEIVITDLEVMNSDYNLEGEEVKKFTSPNDPWAPSYSKETPYVIKTTIGDEGFDYNGSTKTSDKVYHESSTTDSTNYN